MTITDEIRATNGHAKGRAVGELPTITLSSGHTIGLRRQPADVLPRLQAAAQQELASEKPEIPTQRMETEPGVWKAIPHEGHPDYQAALAAWTAKTQSRAGEKALLLIERIALVFTIDDAALKQLREDYATLGMELPANDRTAYLSYVLAPTREDQGRIFEEVFGRALPTEAQVAMHRHLFPRHVEGLTD